MLFGDGAEIDADGGIFIVGLAETDHLFVHFIELDSVGSDDK